MDSRFRENGEASGRGVESVEKCLVNFEAGSFAGRLSRGICLLLSEVLSGSADFGSPLVIGQSLFLSVSDPFALVNIHGCSV